MPLKVFHSKVFFEVLDLVPAGSLPFNFPSHIIWDSVNPSPWQPLIVAKWRHLPQRGAKTTPHRGNNNALRCWFLIIDFTRGFVPLSWKIS